MLTAKFTHEDGTHEEKLDALCALVIQQQGYIKLLTLMVADVYARHPGEEHADSGVAAQLVENMLPGKIREAAHEFDQYILTNRINAIKNEPE
ncbi:MAG: hypothetical protein ACRYG7_07720 [Janthinobacterium lividum]